jgi:hypothetical protein
MRPEAAAVSPSGNLQDRCPHQEPAHRASAHFLPHHDEMMASVHACIMYSPWTLAALALRSQKL